MATQRQIESARINGVKSRGPKTPEGKRRSSMNSRKHGLTSKTIAADPDSDAEFHAAVAAYMAEFRPASSKQLLLVYELAASKIRQRQAWAAETAAWNRALAAQNGCIGSAFMMLAESGELACILRYQTRFSRQYHRVFTQLLAACDLRLRNEPDPPASNPPSHSDFAKRTGLIAIHPRRRCSHSCFLPNEPAAQRRHRVRDEATVGSKRK